jgi:signal transduction histidine kinase/HAMP domain-containing protein
MRRIPVSRRSKIAIRVIMAFLALVIFQGVVSIVGVTFIVSSANRESFNAEMRRTVESVAAYIDDGIRDAKVKTSLLAGQKKVIEYTDYGLSNLLRQELTVFRQPMKIDAVCVLQADSRVVAASGQPSVIRLAEENAMVRSYLGGEPVFILAYENKLYLWALSPVLRDREVIGYLAAAVQLDRAFLRPLESATSARVMLSLSNQAFVSTGLLDRVTIHILESYYRKPFTSQSRVSGRVGSLVYTAAVIPSLPELYAYCFLDTEKFQQLLAQYSLFSVGFLVIVVMVAFALALVIYRATFLRPLRLFMEGVERVAEGDLTHVIDTSTEDEFGDLAAAFGRMTRNLQAREREVAALGQYNALILSNVPSGIVTLDLDGRISGFNAGFPEILRIDAVRLSTGLPIGGLGLEPDVLSLVTDALERAAYVSFRDVTVADAEGARRILSVSTSPFVSGEDVRIGVLAVFADVTKERLLEERLAVSGRMAAMGEMVAGVAHQIRNPLAIMRVSAEMLRDSVEGGDNARRLAAVITEEAESLDSVVRNLLDFVRPLTVHKQATDVESLVRRTILFLPMERFRGIELSYNLGGGSLRHELDGPLIQQALANILTNALEASRPGQAVTVAAYPSDGRLVLEVRDNGGGMPAEVRRSALSPFFTTKDRGTGLGLSIVHKIVEGHGGTVELLSEPGAGTTFRLIV